MKFDGSVAIITGAAQGIGAVTAERMAALGARVAILDLSLDMAEKTALRLSRNGGGAMAVQADVSRFEDIKEAVNRVVERYGVVDILVNNAGWTETHPFLDEDEAYWEKVIAINLKGPILASKTVLPYMVEKGCGKIVNVASEAGRIGNVGEVVYSASKGGLITFTKALARETARHKININCVCPGPTNTPLLRHQPKKLIDAITKMTPFRRVAECSEVADAIIFFCSNRADFITGEVISVSGGLTMAG
jgi:2-hydroxycyclohexanecarboxyl-CoA dehydrogenase